MVSHVNFSRVDATTAGFFSVQLLAGCCKIVTRWNKSILLTELEKKARTGPLALALVLGLASDV